MTQTSNVTPRSIDCASRASRGHLGYQKWTLCIGSGVSSGVVPTWQELARRVINQTFGLNYSESEFETMSSTRGWTLDSWIQAAANHHALTGGDRQTFDQILRHNLYADLLSTARNAGLEKEVTETLCAPRAASKGKTQRVCAFFETYYGHTSLVGMVHWLLKAQVGVKLPMAVISFNAEPLLHSVFELFQRRAHYSQQIPHSHPEYCFVRVIRPNIIPAGSGRDPSKVCVYHCHGALLPSQDSVASKSREPRREHIVFLEEDYLKVATKAATWPQTLFMFHASISRLVFVGLSLSDQNIRRWLGVSNEMAQNGEIHRGPMSGPPHLWISKRPAQDTEVQLLTEGIWHLGVRPAWINDWPDLADGLSNLTAV